MQQNVSYSDGQIVNFTKNPGENPVPGYPGKFPRYPIRLDQEAKAFAEYLIINNDKVQLMARK